LFDTAEVPTVSRFAFQSLDAGFIVTLTMLGQAAYECEHAADTGIFPQRHFRIEPKLPTKAAARNGILGLEQRFRGLLLSARFTGKRFEWTTADGGRRTPIIFAAASPGEEARDI
jgi:hypothetical protein